MSPRFYSFLWVLFFGSAGMMWLLGGLSMIAIVTFGFVAFGMVFMGMMCVLPGTVSHSSPQKETNALANAPAKQQAVRMTSAVPGLSAYRSV